MGAASARSFGEGSSCANFLFCIRGIRPLRTLLFIFVYFCLFVCLFVFCFCFSCSLLSLFLFCILQFLLLAVVVISASSQVKKIFNKSYLLQNTKLAPQIVPKNQNLLKREKLISKVYFQGCISTTNVEKLRQSK